MLIPPTPGRVVWFYPDPNSAESGFARNIDGQPLAALIARVWSDRMVNLMVVDANGVCHPRTSVHLVQEDGEPQPSGDYCTWMPFQKGQAAKADAEKAAPKNDHAAAVLYPAIKAAMVELDNLPPKFNDAVNRAFNHLHRAFWSETPAPVGAAPLRPEAW
ncbi:hypothetical protein D9M73_70710 [compost metagenome]